MRSLFILIITAIALGSAPGLAKDKGCPPGLAKKDPPCVPPGLAKKGVTAEEWSGSRGDHDDDDDRDDDVVVFDSDDLPRYLVRPNGREIDLRERGDGWRIIDGITTRDGLPAYVLAPNGRIYRIEDRERNRWYLAGSEDIVRLPRRDDGRELYLLDDEVVEVINRETAPYVRLLGAIDDILN